MGASNKRSKHFNMDRHEYNNKITGITPNNNEGLILVLNLILITILGSIYLIYKLYQKRKKSKCKNTNYELCYNDIIYECNNVEIETSTDWKNYIM